MKKILFINSYVNGRGAGRSQKNKISNENLSKKINQSWLTICTSSYANVLLGKYIETSMSNSCVLGDMPPDGLNYWKDNYIHIDNKMSDNEIIEIINNSLKDKENIKNKIKNMNRIIKIFNLSNFSDKIYYNIL